MSFRFEQHESVAEGVTRIASETIMKAGELLQSPMNDPESAVHDVRTSIKRLRALLRMIRPRMDDIQFRRDDSLFRNIARGLATTRERAVTAATLSRLRERYPEEYSFSLGAPLQEYIAVEDEHVRPDDATRNRSIDQLEESRRRVDLWHVGRRDFRAIRRGIELTYRNARRRHRDVLDDPTAEELHAWRRQVKYVWNMLRPLTPMWPRVLNALANSYRDLAETLGDDHDLVMLRNLAATLGEPPEALLALIDRRREELIADATNAGARLFVHSPDSFVAWLEQLWGLWNGESESTPA